MPHGQAPQPLASRLLQVSKGQFKAGSRGQNTSCKLSCQNVKCFTAAGQGVHGSLEIAEWFDKQNKTGWQELLQQRQGCDVISLAHFLPHQVFSSFPFGRVFRVHLSVLISSLYIILCYVCMTYVLLFVCAEEFVM